MANSYGFDPVAWSIDGGRHRGELLRVLAYAATGGAEGIVSPGDCKVHALSTPGGQVAIDAGGVLIRNRSANVRNQTYAANGRTESRLDVTQTGSGGGRSDLVVVRVEDPQYAPWPQPAAGAAADYQYVKPFIIENVPATTRTARDLNLNYSAVALARLDIPANTSTITSTMVKDLRKLAQPRTDGDIQSRNFDPGEGGILTSTSYVGFPTFYPQFEVPEWCTWMNSVHLVSGVGVINAPADGSIRATIRIPGQAPFILMPEVIFDVDPGSSGGGLRIQTLMFTAGGYVPPEVRGKTVEVRLEGKRNPVHAGYLDATVTGVQMVSDVRFYERTV